MPRQKSQIKYSSPEHTELRAWRSPALPVLVKRCFLNPEMTMVRTILVLGLLITSFAAPSAYGQTAPAPAAQPTANAVDPASIQALQDMGAFLQTLKRFQVSTELTGERVLADGQKLQHTA